jgi:hypothetical protein
MFGTANKKQSYKRKIKKYLYNPRYIPQERPQGAFILDTMFCVRRFNTAALRKLHNSENYSRLHRRIRKKSNSDMHSRLEWNSNPRLQCSGVSYSKRLVERGQRMRQCRRKVAPVYDKKVHRGSGETATLILELGTRWR